MATTRYKGANSSERLSLSTLSDSDMFQARHLPGTVNDADKGVSKSLLQALPIAVCATAAATAAKVATLAAESCPDFTLVNGRVVHIYFSAANEASTPTLNLAGTGAIPITYPNGDFVGDWSAGCTLDLMYINIVDGNTSIERWVLVSNLPVNEVTANNMQSVSGKAVAEMFLNSISNDFVISFSNKTANVTGILYLTIQKHNTRTVTVQEDNVSLIGTDVYASGIGLIPITVLIRKGHQYKIDNSTDTEVSIYIQKFIPLYS